MKKALYLLLLAALVGIGLRYVFPKTMIASPKEEKHVDELLAVVLDEEAQAVDTVVPLVVKDTIPKVKKDTIAIKKPKEQPQRAKGNYLNGFFEKLLKLEQTGKGQVRIAVFGDSMLDADMLVMQFRHYLQKRFGGLGVGYVPITSVSASGRYSVKHSFSSNWKKQTFLRKNDTIFPFGINGEVFFTGDTTEVATAMVKFKKGGAYRELPLINPMLFYGKQRTFYSISVNSPIVKIKADSVEQELVVEGERYLNSVKLPTNAKQLELTIEDAGTLPLYGVSFASANGVIVDNLAIRGNSGLPLSRLQTNLMQQFNRYFDYDLVILSYGTNVFNPEYEKSYAWYGRRMERIVKHLQNCFSGVDVVVVSMADRAVKIDEEMQTPERLADFIKVEQSIADHTQSGFFSLYDAMGGAGSMKTWAETEPPLANKDYTHFNSRGAEKAARMFYGWMMKQYENFVAKREKKAEIKTSKIQVEENTTQ